MALTLLRAVGNGVRAPEQQVAGQMQGEFTFEYSLYPHAGDWEEAASYRQAHAFNAPLAVGQSSVKDGDLPAQASLVSIDADAFALSAVKLAESGDALVVRGCNIGSEQQAIVANMSLASDAELVDLKEDPILRIQSDQGAFSMETAPKRIVTCKVRRR